MKTSELIDILRQLKEQRGDLEVYVDVDVRTPYQKVDNAKVVMPPDQAEGSDPRIIITVLQN